MNFNQITVGIVTFKSEKVIFDCLKSIKKIKNIIIFDNSHDHILKKILKASNNSKTPRMLLIIKGFGESIDLSTCVSAAKLNIQRGLNFLKIPKSCFLLLISHFINV